MRARSLTLLCLLQEYTLIKIRLSSVPPSHPHAAALAPLASLMAAGKAVYFTAATLRPETMYGQVSLPCASFRGNLNARDHVRTGA